MSKTIRAKNLVGRRFSILHDALDFITTEIESAVSEIVESPDSMIISVSHNIASIGSTDHTPSAVIVYSQEV